MSHTVLTALLPVFQEDDVLSWKRCYMTLFDAFQKTSKTQGE
jgi:hypothetical protein